MARLSKCYRCGKLKPLGQSCPCTASTEPDRGTTSERGYGARWQRYSSWYRRRNPYCVACLAAGKIGVPAQLVDHIRPFHVAGSIDNDLKWNAGNHQSLCDECHNNLKGPLEERWRHDPDRLVAEWNAVLERLKREASREGQASNPD